MIHPWHLAWFELVLLTVVGIQSHTPLVMELARHGTKELEQGMIVIEGYVARRGYRRRSSNKLWAWQIEFERRARWYALANKWRQWEKWRKEHLQYLPDLGHSLWSVRLSNHSVIGTLEKHTTTLTFTSFPGVISAVTGIFPHSGENEKTDNRDTTHNTKRTQRKTDLSR